CTYLSISHSRYVCYAVHYLRALPFFILLCYVALCVLRSFPTRRSSDLIVFATDIDETSCLSLGIKRIPSFCGSKSTSRNLIFFSIDIGSIFVYKEGK